MEAFAPRPPRLVFVLLSLALLPVYAAGPAAAALSPGQRVCVDGLSRALDKVDRQVTQQIGGCLKRHGAGKALDPKDPSITTLEACAAADARGRIARALDATQKQFEKLCTPPPTGKLEDPFPAFGATDAARVNGAALALSPDLAHDLFGSDLDVALAIGGDAPKCQQAVWKAAARCQQARSAAFRSCQKSALAGGKGAAAAEAREELRGACLGVGPEEQPDPKGRLAAMCSEPGKGIAGALAKACGGRDLDALLPGCGREPDPAACLDRQVACRACRELSSAGDLRRSCDLFDDGEANASCGETSIVCESPADGAMVVATPGAEIEVAGQVPDPTQIESVTVDGVPVTLDDEGFFSHPVTADFGVHFVGVTAFDETGGEARRFCTFLASESFAAEDAFLDDGLSLTLAQAAVDDANRGGALNSLGDILQAVVNSSGLRDQIHAELLAANPLKPSACDTTGPLGTCFLSSRVDYTGSSLAGPNGVVLDLVQDGIDTTATLRNLSVSVRARGSFLGIAFDVSGTVSAASLTASLTSDLSVQDGALAASVRSGSVDVSAGTITVSIDGVPQLVTDVIVFLAQGIIRNAIEDALRDIATGELGPVLADSLENLQLPSKVFDVPRLAAPGSIALSLETAASSASVTNARALLGVAVRAGVAADHALPSLGAALPSGPVLGEPGTSTPLAFAGHLGALNQILHALWRGGLLHGHVDESVLPELGPGVEAELEALLPPVVSTDGDSGLAQLGALLVTLTYPGFFDTPVLLSAGAEASLTLAAEGDSLLLESLAPVAVHVSGVDAALAPAEQALVDLVAAVVLQRLLESALAAAAEGLPILAFELPASVGPYGLPAGSPLGVVNRALELTPTHLYVKGSLGILTP